MKAMKALSKLQRHPLSLAAALSVAIISSTLLPVTTEAAPRAATAKAAVQQYVLKTGMVDGKFVYIDTNGKANPVLHAKVGDTIEITVSSGEGAEHDIAVPDLKVASTKFNASSGPTTLKFKAERAGKFAYICTIPGHRQIGMEGVLEVADKS